MEGVFFLVISVNRVCAPLQLLFPGLSTFHHRSREAPSLGGGTEHKGNISLGPWWCGGTSGKSKEMGKGSQHSLNS